MRWRKSQRVRPAEWPFSLPSSLTAEEIEQVRRRVDELSDRAQYGWVHTVDFGPFTKEGVMKDDFLGIAGRWDAWGWWLDSLKGLRVADVGCATGGLSLLMAHRGAEEVLAVEEVPEFADQCAYLCEVFGVKNVRALNTSLYRLPEMVEPGSLDLIVLSGVLYHLSDMLVGLYIMRELLKVGGTLLIESEAVDDDRRSYANFGRFAMGMWWQPSTLCVRDMCEFMGLSDVEIRVYRPRRCLARARKANDERIAFRRGMNYAFDDLRDDTPRSMDLRHIAPK